MTVTESTNEGDTWDLASSVGATATAVAASRAMASQGPDALLDDPFAEPLVRAVGIDTSSSSSTATRHRGRSAAEPPRDERADGRAHPLLRRLLHRGNSFRNPTGGHPGLRASTPGLPAAWPAGTVVFEIDQPEVIEFKTRTLADLGARADCATAQTVAIDLRDDWPSALKEAGFDPSAPTAWSAEGLLVYLPPEAQDRLFDNITALSAPGSRIATEHMDMARTACGLGGEADRAVAAHRLRHQPGRVVLHRRAQQRGRLPVRQRLAGRRPQDRRRVRRATDSNFPTTNWRRSVAIPAISRQS